MTDMIELFMYAVLPAVVSSTALPTHDVINVTSDTHLTNKPRGPVGASLEQVVQGLSDEEPTIIVGDVIDGYYLDEIESELNMVDDMKAQRDVYLSLGAGHDYRTGGLSFDQAMNRFDTRNMVLRSGDYHIVLFSGTDPTWLHKVLPKYDNIIFMTHIPFKSDGTVELSRGWFHGKDITQPSPSPVEDVIIENLEKISYFVFGHLHLSADTTVFGKQAYFCAWDNMCTIRKGVMHTK